MFPNQPNGFRVLETPYFLKWIFESPPVPPVDIHERPGGFNWGGEPTDNVQAEQVLADTEDE